MYVYCTSKQRQNSIGHNTEILYLGTSVQEAEKAVGDWDQYYVEEKDFPTNFQQLYSAIPKEQVNWEMIQFYFDGAYWVSIVVFELKLEE